MRRFIIRLSLLTLLLGGTGSAPAAIITYVESGTLSLYQGLNPLGLDGASFSVIETIDSAATPVHTSFNPTTNVYSATYDTISTSLTITGSSVNGIDGIYTTPLQISVSSRPSGSSIGFGISFGAIGGNNVSIPSAMLPVGTVQVNTYPMLPLYSPSIVQGFSFFTTTAPGNAITFYNVLDGTSSGSEAVPEPSSLILAGAAALAGLGAWSRRRGR